MRKPPPNQLSHYDEHGNVSMVDISGKAITERSAIAQAFVRMSPEVLEALPQNKKGNPLEIARIAGIMAAKRTSELIPLCHPLSLTHVDVQCLMASEGVMVLASATTNGRTGVEMEAMTAATVAALTIYDMTKALDKAIEIQDVYLVEKTGGKSGVYRRKADKA